MGCGGEEGGGGQGAPGEDGAGEESTPGKFQKKATNLKKLKIMLSKRKIGCGISIFGVWRSAELTKGAL